MYAKIKEISTVEGTPLTYVLIHIWANKALHDQGKASIGDNDFLMELYPTGQRVVQDAQGRYKRIDGVFVHPDAAIGDEEWERETFNIDLPVQIRENIVAYLGRRDRVKRTKGAFPRAHANPTTRRSQDDPRGILGRSEVQDLVGTGAESR